jgi:hypothetical protein
LPIAVAALACAPSNIQHRPQSPIVADHDDQHAEVTGIIVAGAPTGYVVQMQLRAPGTLRAARLASSSAAPCDGSGPGASTIELGGTIHVERPLVLADRSIDLRLGFPSEVFFGPRDMSGDGFVDLETVAAGRTGCMRVPLFSDAITWRKVSRWSMGWNVGLFPPFSLGFSLGRWLGPVRLGAELGASSYQCDACARGAGHLLVPASVTVESYLYSRVGVGLGLQLAYDAVPAFAVGARKDALFLHGPRVGVKLAVTQPARGLEYGPAVASWYASAYRASWATGNPFEGPGFFAFGVGWDYGL